MPEREWVRGRYNKLARGLPQTVWHCKKCYGKGCKACEGTGRVYPDSVEEIIARPFEKALEPERIVFHCAGREDLDVRMLGNGRPFFLQIVNPKKSLSEQGLGFLGEEINKGDSVKVNGFVLSSKKEMLEEFSRARDKTYKALVECSKQLKEENLEKLGALKGIVRQFTPERVSHRRALRERQRKVLSVKTRFLGPKRFELELSTEAGTYIKELIAGHNTEPSVSMLLGTECKCIELDVTAIL